jgi:membrane fusion protein (multidrug efflux system)
MKTIRLSLTGIALLFLLISCGGDKKAELEKLKQKHAAITDQIKALEEEINASKNGVAAKDESKFVAVTEVKESRFDHYIRVQGKLDGDQNAAVFAEAPGTVTARYADVGNSVKKGQVLAQIDDQQYKSQLEGLEAQYKFALEMFTKQERLWEQKIGSEVQYLQSKTTKESLERQIESLKQSIEKFKIKSPIDGTIEECNIKVGGVVSPDPRLAAFRVVQFSNMKVTAEVSEAYSSRVTRGDKLLITFPDANRQVESEVSFVSNYINPVNRTFLIETRIKGSATDLKANMIAIIQINDYHNDKSVTVPQNVIQTDGAGSYVYVVRAKDNSTVAFKQMVTIGNSYNGVAEIIKGLGIGDKVVSAGYQELIDGELVRF